MAPSLLGSTFSAIHVAYDSGTVALLRFLSTAAASTAVAAAAARGECFSRHRRRRKEKPRYESVHPAEFQGTRKTKMNSGQRGNERGNENEMLGRTKGGKPSEARVATGVPLPPPPPSSSPSSSPSPSSRRGFCWRRLEPGSPGALLAVLTLSLLCVPSAGAAKGDMSANQEPVFLEPVANVTVAMGRDALLSCVVDNLGQHQVAWIHLDREMILSIHKHVVIRQSRFHVTHDNHKTWTLHIAQVTLDDHGTYMCQVNSEKMISQVGYLKVVVPPDINDTVSSPSGIVVKEGDNVTMLCRGQGFPQPDIKWVREDGVPIKVDGGRHVMSFAGETLTLKKTSRTDMGAYLCIASNGVPPSVSKRIMLQVEFAPMMHVPNQLVAYPVTREARLECFVEAHPRAITYWEYNENMVMNNSRIRTQTYEKDYKVKMLLIIHNLSRSDMGMYKCIAKNSIGETNGSITLHVVDLITQPPNTKGAFDDYRNRDDLISKKKGHSEVNQALELDHDIRREQRLQHLDSAGNENEMERRRLDDDSRRRSQEVQRLEHDQHYTKGHVQDPPGTHHSNEATQLGHHCPSKLLVLSLFLSLLLDSLRSVFCRSWPKCTRKSFL